MRYTQRNPNQIPRHRTYNYLQNSVTLDYVGLGGLSLEATRVSQLSCTAFFY